MSPPVAITDPALLARQTLPDEAFLDHFLELIATLPAREWNDEAFERGLRYPWYRPERSYLLRDGETSLLHELDEPQREALVEKYAGEAPDRVGVLAFGSNAAPKNLTLKLAHHEAPEDREVLLLAGELHGLDVVGSAAVTVYGAVPATLAASPGTSVSATLMFVTPTQLTTLTWGEMTYQLGRLRGAPFTAEDGVDGFRVESPLAYVSRWGAFLPDGAPAPLGAIPGRDRSRTWSQRELLDRVAEIVLGPGGGDARDFMRILHTDAPAMAARALPLLREHAQPFAYPDWIPIGADGTVPTE